MKTLKFKNVGWFAEEASARYEAVINDNLKVRIWKSFYMKGFKFEFITTSGYDLGRINGDFMCAFWDKATKKDAIERVINIINDEECLHNLTESAKRKELTII